MIGRRLNLWPERLAFGFVFALGFAASVLVLSAWLTEQRTIKEQAAAEAGLADAIARRDNERAGRRMETEKYLGAFLMTSDQREAVRGVLARNVDRDFSSVHVARMIWAESRGNPKAIGKQGEIGLCQIKENIGLLYGRSRAELFDPVINVTVCMAELKRLNNIFGSAGLSIAAYAGGPTAALYYAATILRVKK